MSSETISICTIFKNEEKLLPDFLDSFENLADEWVLTDTGSSDGSLDIIRDKGIECLFFEWCDHFSRARNYGIEQAKSDWIFVADVDDRIRPADIKTFKKVLQETDAAAITVNYVNLKKSDWLAEEPIEINRQIRMVCFRNGLGIHYRGAVHEDPMVSIEELGGELIHLDIPVYHLGYADDLLEAKLIRNSRLLSQQWENGHRDPDLTHYYTSMHWGPEIWIREALENVQKQIKSERSKRLIEDLYYWYMDFDPKSCRKIEQELKNKRPGSAALLLQSARKSFFEQQSELAIQLFNGLWLQSELSYPTRYRSEVALRLAFLYASQGDLETANQVISSYRERYSWTPSLWHLKLKVLATLGSWSQIQDLLRQTIPNFISALEEYKQKEIIQIFKHSPVRLDIPVELQKLLMQD